MFPDSGTIDIEPLSSEQTGVDRPRPRAEHGNANREDGQENSNPNAFTGRRVERAPNFVERNHCSHCRSPQTGKQEDAARGGYQVLYKDSTLRGTPEIRDAEIEQSESETSP